MPDSTVTATLRKSTGYLFLALSCIAWVGVPAVAFTAMETAEKVAAAGALYLFSQVTWVLCIVLLGPEVLQWLQKGRDHIRTRFRRN